jgi:hypothetical protein
VSGKRGAGVSGKTEVEVRGNRGVRVRGKTEVKAREKRGGEGGERGGVVKVIGKTEERLSCMNFKMNRL